MLPDYSLIHIFKSISEANILRLKTDGFHSPINSTYNLNSNKKSKVSIQENIIFL